MSWWKTAKPGDKIVCTNVSTEDFAPPNYPDKNLDGLSAGVVYTVRSVQMCPVWHDVTVCLAEIHRKPWRGIEIGFAAPRFRPVQTKSTETGMAILRKLLTGKRERVRQ